jgi:hypothetical protein
MSTGFELVCEKHKVTCYACTQNIAGAVSEASEMLTLFIVKHEGCLLLVVSEHRDVVERALFGEDGWSVFGKEEDI